MNKTVLVIDDAGFDRTIIVALLNQTNFTVIGEACNGKDGLEMAIKLKPDIITLDKLMPDMNGLEVLQKLREAKVTSKVILISGDEMESIQTVCTNLGVELFIEKPFSRDQLLHALTTV